VATRGPLTPREAQTTFRVPKGFKVELAACEPDVVDPVAMAFDENGRLLVAEMVGYPNGGLGMGNISSGRVKVLEDKDGDGFFEKNTLFASGLRFPTSVMPWKGGLVVANAPDITYLEDSDGDGKADRQRVLYTGFDVYNIQQLVNSLQWGLDNWVYGCAGGKGGLIRSLEKPDMPEVTLRGRGIRFHPEKPGSLEPMSGGGQFGLSADDWGAWFTATNSQHLRQIILPDHYLRRNPYLPVSAVTLDISDHNPACKVHRLSPFEAWRVERTTRRKEGTDSKRFSATELVPGGFVTSGCSPVVYTADRFPEAYRGSTFVCDPANNLIHRDVLVPKGAIFTAKRGHEDCEFLASTDTWFRPVNLAIGPDGGLYVSDFYREIIETPLSLPDDIKERWNLESRGRGRIWRIVPEEKKQVQKPNLATAPSADLVAHLADGNSWWRLTAQRLLVERQDSSVVKAVRHLVENAKSPQGRAHALWTLQGLRALEENDILRALKDSEAGVRAQGLRLAEGTLAQSTALQKAVAQLAGDPSPRVRFQLAFTAGEGGGRETLLALLRVAWQDAGDPWTQTAVLSSAGKDPAGLLDVWVRDTDLLEKGTTAHLQLMTRLASLAGASASDQGLAKALNLLGDQSLARPGPWQIALLTGLGQGLQNSNRSLEKLWTDPPAALQRAVQGARPFFTEAGRTARTEKVSVEDRLAAIRLLGFGPLPSAVEALPALLDSQHPQEIQLAAVRSLSSHTSPRVAALLLEPWSGYSPAVRREVLEALFARTDRVRILLDAMDQKKVLGGHLEPARLDQLRKHPDAALRKRAQKLLVGQVAPARQKIVQDYEAALDLKAEAARGKAVFKKSCATCHRLENEGVEVGADLQSILRNKAPETLLVDILDPSREVDPRFIEYLVTLKSGKVVSGLIAAETATSVTLRRAEKAEDTILRNQIESIQATTRSLMPEGLEMQLSRQDVADVIAYLQSQRK
jgi:putative membrane-bound dehydrogenase-like protein